MSVGLVSISVKQISKNKIKFSDSINKLLNDLENEISKQIDNYICSPNVQNSISDVQKYAETIIKNLNNLINKKNKLSKTLNDLIKIFKTLTKIIDVTGDTPIEMKGYVPARSVVIPGSYTKKFGAGEYQVPCALIIGKRKPSTDLKTSLNDALREYDVAV